MEMIFTYENEYVVNKGKLTQILHLIFTFVFLILINIDFEFEHKTTKIFISNVGFCIEEKIYINSSSFKLKIILKSIPYIYFILCIYTLFISFFLSCNF